MKNAHYSILTIIILLLNSCSNAQTSTFNLSVSDFSKKIKELPSAPLVDVRTPEEYSKGHLSNAANINWNDDNFDAEISKLDKSKPVFVYCLSGGRSGSAAKKMRADGFKEVYELAGGIMKWRGANLPETTNTNKLSIGMSKQQYDSLIISDKTILIDFYADWCGSCKKMKPYLEEISEDMVSSVSVIRINADDNKALMKQLNIDELPTLLVYKKSMLTWRNSGYVGKEDLVKQLK